MPVTCSKHALSPVFGDSLLNASGANHHWATSSLSIRKTVALASAQHLLNFNTAFTAAYSLFVSN